MASKLPATAQAVISKCELCDLERDARWMCTDCNEEMCKQCKYTHLKMKVSKHHNIMSIANDVEDPKRDQDPKKNILCSSHPEEPVQMYCNDCENLVCFTCIAGKQHQNHRFDKIDDIIVKYRGELSQYITETKQNISGLQSSLLLVQNNETTYSTQSSNTIDQINKERQDRKSQIDAMADGLIQQVKQCEGRDLQKLRDQGLEINEHISDKKDILQVCENKLRSTHDASIIKFVVDIKQRQKRSIGIPSIISPFRFVRSDPVDLQSVFGHLEGNKNDDKTSSASLDRDVDMSPTTDTTVLANITTGIGSLCVSAVNDRQAWCGKGYGNGKTVTLVNIDGKEIKKLIMNFNLYDLTVTPTEEFILTEYKGHHIKKYTQKEKFVNIADTSPYMARGLCMTSDSHILVCLYKNETSSKVIRLTGEGQVQQTIQNDQHNKPLFTNPRIVTENINKDICVVDGYNTVAVVNKEGQFRFKYPNSSSSYITVTIGECNGIACDKLGYILISDSIKHRIHQIDKEGQFIQHILTRKHGIKNPWDISIDDKGKLWICNNDGFELKVVKYRS